jgi:hypothetical protein
VGEAKRGEVTNNAQKVSRRGNSSVALEGSIPLGSFEQPQHTSSLRNSNRSSIQGARSNEDSDVQETILRSFA